MYQFYQQRDYKDSDLLSLELEELFCFITQQQSTFPSISRLANRQKKP